MPPRANLDVPLAGPDGLLGSETLGMTAHAASREFEKISPESLRKGLRDMTAATADGKISATNMYEETPFTGEEYPGYAWPWWAFTVNPISSATWDATVPAGKSVTFEYDWYYYQRP